MLFRFADFTLDEARLELSRGGAKVPIQPQSRDVLLLLVKNRHRMVGKRELVDAVWGGVMLSETALAQAMMRLRRALDDDPERPRMVETVRGRGYRFVANVTEHEATHRESPRPFVGRAPILAALRGRYERAAAGYGSVALVAGEPGIGRSRLLEELGARLRASGARVAVAYGGSGGPSLWPWREAARAIAEQGGVEAARVPADPAEPFQAYEALARFFRDAARSAPVAVLLDDVHADGPDSATFLKFLARAIHDARLLIVASYREAPRAPDDPLALAIATLVRADPGAKITLGPLAPPEVSELAQAILGCAPAAELLARLGEKAAGNPLLITQLLHATREGDATRQGEPNAASTSSLLDEGSLQEAIGAQLGEVSAAAVRVLTLAAVLGRLFELGPLARMAGCDVPQLLATMEEALRARVIAKERSGAHRYRFVHALVRDLLYKRIPGADRVARHWAAAHALLAFAPNPAFQELDAIAKHFVAAAAPADAEPAMVWSVRAAECALDAADVDGALDHLWSARTALRLRRDVPLASVEAGLRRLKAHPALGDVATELLELLQPR